MATFAIVKNETNSWKWPLIMIVYMTGLAYIGSLLVYQGGQMLGFT
jgi:ferrous iron transport protein B